MATNESAPNCCDSTVFTSVEELDEANKQVGWDSEYRQLSGDSFEGQIFSREYGDITVASERMKGDLQVRASQPVESLCFFLPDCHRGSIRLGKDNLTARDVIVCPGGQELQLFTSGLLTHQCLWLPIDYFHSDLKALVPELPTLNTIDFVSGDCERLTHIAKRVRSAYLDSSKSMEDVSEVVIDLALWLADSFDIKEKKGSHANNNALTRDAKRMREYIEDHLGENIDLQELCIASGIGLRTLYRRFEEYFQMTPNQYIRAQRLNRAHRLLRAAEPEQTTVTEIATRCGYTHFGRFAVEYRQLFGEMPSTILHR